jgi:hypothetical protein
MKQITNYPNYLISLDGKVFSLTTMKYLSQSTTPAGYKHVRIQNENGNKTFLVHRLVASSYIKNNENKAQVNHIDGNKKNNCLLNLEWSTPSENQKHSYRIGLAKSNNKQKEAARINGRLVGKQNGIVGGLKKRKLVINIETGIFYNGIQEAANSIGIKKGTLNAMLVGQNKNKTNLRYA